MNNEEKILAMLEQLQQGQVAMQGDITATQADVADIKNRVTTIEVVQENKVFKKSIQLLSDRNVSA